MTDVLLRLFCSSVRLFVNDLKVLDSASSTPPYTYPCWEICQRLHESQQGHRHELWPGRSAKESAAWNAFDRLFQSGRHGVSTTSVGILRLHSQKHRSMLPHPRSVLDDLPSVSVRLSRPAQMILNHRISAGNDLVEARKAPEASKSFRL
ncbi:hypothetical protein GALMADRAFT_217122 [Galerina marginata CBS 339.88]|uniref:Uncharacterized protein n=1 Tax=Galerina marginata (strain CBS 339.88) TaxID=685588 RepID=A0A067S8J3_GALM3|nr:hypothetical protein GALMADRAFT_217122 [Galerina marginata CBS 339.88]